MKKRESELIVKSVLAGIASKYAITDIDSRKQLRTFGIDRPQFDRLKKRLLLALSGEPKPDSKRFLAALKITPTSTVAAVAAQLPKVYKDSLRAGSATKAPFEFKGLRKSDVEIAVRTALAQSSRKYSVLQIKRKMDLIDLGLDQAGIVRVKTSIHRTFSGARPLIKLADFIHAQPGKKSSKVEDLLHASIRTFSLPGEGTVVIRGGLGKRKGGYNRVASLSGDGNTDQRGGLGGKRRIP